MFSLSGAAAGGADALEEILKQKFIEITERQRQKQQADMLGETRRQNDMVQARFDTQRGDALSRDAAAKAERAAAAAAAKAQRDAFLQQFPHLAGMVQAGDVGLNVKDPHELETPEAHQPHVEADDARRIANVEKEATARERVQARFRVTPKAERKWILRGGQPAYVPEDQIRPGDTPYESQGQKPATEAQSKAALYANRLEQSEPILQTLESSVSMMNPLAFDAQMMADKPWAQSDSVQQYSQASRNFINAVLRRESGAVISPSEFSEARKQYLPVPGDTVATRKQKAQNRAVVLDNLKREGASAYKPLTTATASSGASAEEYDYVPGKGLVPRKK